MASAIVFWFPGSQNGLHVVVDNGEQEEQYFNGYSGSGAASCADSLRYITDIRRCTDPGQPLDPAAR